ncbi:hypothetical protein RSOLAG1IB_06880 [Rhizoctonia solani AG-1 IB]|uniref:Uncharacterized protein n=1 Tax=Thanatephorus cucumeris (strain AG1-IB / isolate 7/3/14) TaxID=1108050 RepID=A0A0B7FB74_THACB|nr:hypothetical protein RSOLAG1IB_06880 [Rhizoctonia solani AG-1 IB]
MIITVPLMGSKSWAQPATKIERVRDQKKVPTPLYLYTLPNPSLDERSAVALQSYFFFSPYTTCFFFPAYR